MALASYNISQRRPELPPAAGDSGDSRNATMLHQFAQWWFRYRTTKRAELERLWNRARLYDAGRQWIAPYRRAGLERYWFTWEPVKGGLFPRPVRNRFSVKVQDEVSRLIGVGSAPWVRLDDPQKEEGARLARQVLLSENEDDRNPWNDEARLGAYHTVMFGQWFATAEYEHCWENLEPFAPDEAVACEACGDIYKSPEVEGSIANELRSAPGAQLLIGADGTLQGAKLNACPKCGGPLSQIESIPRDMWISQDDALGRPLAQMLPRGDHVIRTRSPYDSYPENQGIGYQRDADMEAIGYRTPRTVDWVKKRFENAEHIKPWHDAEVFAHHPIMLTHGMGHYAAYTDGVWSNWGMLDEIYIKPNRDFARGRAIVLWNQDVLLDADYYYPDTEIPRVESSVSQWELRENEIWGKPLSEDLFSAQDNLNSALSQAMNIRQKFTDPKMILWEGMDLRQRGGPNARSGSDVWTLSGKGVPPELLARFPLFIGEKSAPPQVWQEMQHDSEYMNEAAGAHGAETGAVQGAELNYSALFFAASKAAERRRPRIESRRRAVRKLWTHRLRCVAHFWDTERLIRFRDDSEEWQVAQVRGMQLQGQTDVQLEDEPLVDSAIADRAAIESGLKYGTIRTSANGGTYRADRRINRAFGVPEELNEDRNLQDDDARGEWKLWLEQEDEPFVDRQGDDHLLHARRHLMDIDGVEGRKLKDELKQLGISWGYDVLRPTWEWEKLFNELNQLKLIVAKIPPQPLQLLQMGINEQAAVELMTKRQKIVEVLIGFPPQLELQIYVCHRRSLRAALNPALFESDGATLIWPVHQLVRFRSHALAHVMLASGVPPTTMALASSQAAPVSAPPPMGPEGGAPPQPGGAGPLGMQMQALAGMPGQGAELPQAQPVATQ